MGFNNKGVNYIKNKLKNKGKIIIGANIGKNKNSEDNFSDYDWSTYILG